MSSERGKIVVICLFSLQISFLLAQFQPHKPPASRHTHDIWWYHGCDFIITGSWKVADKRGHPLDGLVGTVLPKAQAPIRVHQNPAACLVSMRIFRF